MRAILRGDPAYPELLDRISVPPPLLWVCGDVDLLGRTAVAMPFGCTAWVDGT